MKLKPHPQTVYQVISDQAGTASTFFICGMLNRGVNDVNADLKALRESGQIAGDKSAWRVAGMPPKVKKTQSGGSIERNPLVRL